MQAKEGLVRMRAPGRPRYQPRPLVTQPRGARNPGDPATDRLSLWKPLDVAASFDLSGFRALPLVFVRLLVGGSRPAVSGVQAALARLRGIPPAWVSSGGNEPNDHRPCWCESPRPLLPFALRLSFWSWLSGENAHF